MENKTYFFTVITPTFNRGGLLRRIYEALNAQTFNDFEWIIIDDGSTDDTKKIVEEFKQGNILVKYLFQTNKGKHMAINRGVERAKGFLIVIIDSDDYLLPEALSSIRETWLGIPESERQNFAGVAGLCVFQDGSVVGSAFPRDILDSNPVEIRTLFNVKGDKFEVFRNDILKFYKFPEEVGSFVTEALVWNRIAKAYKVRYVNKVWKVVEYRKDGLSNKSVLIRARNPNAACLYYKEFLEIRDLYVPLSHKFRAMVNYCRFSFHRKMIRFYSSFSKLQFIIAIPLGFAMYLYDLIRIFKINRNLVE
ncbi:MAG: glycosyltransferase family 2 protein [Caldisericum sp.]|uniref:glycosyltransferase family 2 protein n=1 Tax=Caldisericum sp. TaxID=2499687 RepID=UPI003D0DAA7F